MSILADPTVTAIVTEGLKKGGRVNPTVGDISDAATIHLQEVKSDIYLKAKCHPSLEWQLCIGTVTGVTRYDWPIYIEQVRSVQLVDAATSGNYRGIAQAGGTSTITLSASLSETDSNNIIGRMVFITSGTGSGQFAQITGWDNTTKIATVSAGWVASGKTAANAWVVPDNTSNYLVENIRFKLWEIDKPQEFDSNPAPFQQGTPNRATMLNRQIWLNMAPDRVYALFVDFYYAIDQLDETDVIFTNHLRKFRNLWTQGIAAKVAQRFDDARATQINQIYNFMLDLYGTTASTIGQVLFRDY